MTVKEWLGEDYQGCSIMSCWCCLCRRVWRLRDLMAGDGQGSGGAGETREEAW